MPACLKGRKVKVRRLADKPGSIEVTVPKILSDSEIIQEGDTLTPVFNSVLVYLPEGKGIDAEKLKEAVIDVTAKEKAEGCRSGVVC